jgi:hypothetical protein
MGKTLLPVTIPCKMLIDKNGNILWTDYVRQTEESKQEFINNLKKFIRENQ